MISALRKIRTTQTEFKTLTMTDESNSLLVYISYSFQKFEYKLDYEGTRTYKQKKNKNVLCNVKI